METSHNPFARPLYIMTKPVGSTCNLACKYCYYLEKNNLYKDRKPDRRFIMTDELLEKFIKMYIESQTMPQVPLCWHGGESLMRPVSFYKRVVGVSIDGPQEFHDEYRKNKIGAPSFHKVMQGINLLKKHDVEWNAPAVVNDYNADYTLENRFARTVNGEPGLHYLCAGYLQYFEHVAPYMDFMANELKNQRPPAKIMSHIADIKA